MKIYGIDTPAVAAAANSVGARLNDNSERGSKVKYVNTTIRPLTNEVPFYKFSYEGRKVNAIDALGHGAFVIALLEQNPDAKIVAGGDISYDGVEGFVLNVREVLDRNIHNQVNPISAYDACTAESKKEWHEVWIPRLTALCEKESIIFPDELVELYPA